MRDANAPLAPTLTLILNLLLTLTLTLSLVGSMPASPPILTLSQLGWLPRDGPPRPEERARVRLTIRVTV